MVRVYIPEHGEPFQGRTVIGEGLHVGSVPTSTYRLQLAPGFGFREAAELAGYLARLGVSHVYVSPVLQAVPGSMHGYDVVDHSRISDDLGGEPGLREMARRFAAAGLGLILDIVPNHMAIPDPEHLNPAVWSVLRDGPASPYAHWFDIDWNAGQGRILLPVLGRSLDDCLATGELTLDSHGVEPIIRYHRHAFPVAPGTERLPLPELLDAQPYALTFWRAGLTATGLNYRRFFDITSLIGLRVEDPNVFAATHRVLLELLDDGTVTGLRVDHPDGLAAPGAYLDRLNTASGGAWTVVEKILSGAERLPTEWACAGTTGYDALNRILGLFVDRSGAEPLTELLGELTGGSADYATVEAEAKRDVSRRLFVPEVQRLVALAASVCRAAGAIHGPRALRAALIELLVAMPVYRVYVASGEPPSRADARVLTEAAERARRSLADEYHDALRTVHRLLVDPHWCAGPAHEELNIRFQQTCGAVLAKGVEDTAFYRWPRLVALNEVGGDPGRFGVAPEEFHAYCTRLARSRPATMTTLSTHDTKRQEDVRARLAVLAELPGEWGRQVRAWQRLGPAGPVEPALRYLLWQTLVGSWPIGVERLVGYLEKAAKEAKTATSWIDPDEAYEDAVRGYAEAVLADPELCGQISGFVVRIAPFARANVLGQKLVQLTMPGVPDVYQGCELPGYALVDPDNRRGVDFEHQRELLARVDERSPQTLEEEKLHVVAHALRLRREHPRTFAGAYRSLVADGPAAEHAVAFLRNGAVVTIATRLPAGLEQRGGWSTTIVELPPGPWYDRLTDTTHDGGPTLLTDLLSHLPVALLTRPA